jgi:hypothetical protein
VIGLGRLIKQPFGSTQAQFLLFPFFFEKKKKKSVFVFAAMNGGGRVRSCHIGINYIGTKNALNGCINDARNMLSCVSTMAREAGVSDVKTLMITDETEVKPTRRGILDAMLWLIKDVQRGDTLFFSFSGHGTSVKDDNGDEADGMVRRRLWVVSVALFMWFFFFFSFFAFFFFPQ